MKTLLRKKVILNIFSLSSARTISIILNFAAVTISARILSVEDFGLFAYYLAIAGVLSKLIDFGFGPVVFRQISKSFDEINLINTAFTFRLLLLLLILTLSNLFLLILNSSFIQYLLMNSFLINLIFSSKNINFRELLDIPFKSTLSIHIPMLVVIMDNMIFLVAVVTMPYLNVSLEYYAIIYVISNLPGFILMIILLWNKFNFRIIFSLKNIRWLIHQSYPLLIYVFISNLFQQLDIILLKYFKDEYYSGIYAVALRLTMPFSIIPSALVTTLFPIIVSKYLIGDEKLNFIIKLSFKLLFILAFFISAIFSFKAEEITILFFGDKYAATGLLATILMWSQIFFFFNFFAIDLFTAFNYQKYTSVYSFILLISNIILLLILVQPFSALGAAIAKILSSFLGFVYIIFLMTKLKIKFNFLNFRLLILCVINLIIFSLISKLNLFLYLSVAITITGLSVLYFGIFSKSELKYFYDSN